jgi:hypothetical protein
MNIETMSAADLRKPIADMEAELEGKTSGMTVEKLRRKARNLREELAAPPPVYLSDEDARRLSGSGCDSQRSASPTRDAGDSRGLCSGSRRISACGAVPTSLCVRFKGR